MDDQPTCGKGLADTAPLATRLGELMAAVADVLEAHLPALDLSDPAARKEQQAYRRLVEEHRDAAHRLAALGKQMGDYRDLPMAHHDEAAMGGPAVRETFKRFVDREEALLTLLKRRLEEDQEMLHAMGRIG